MKQIEIDSHIGNWFSCLKSLEDAKAELSRAIMHFDAATEQCARALLPTNVSQEERWIFPTTDGRAVAAFLWKKTSYSTDGTEHVEWVPTVIEHTFKR